MSIYFLNEMNSCIPTTQFKQQNIPRKALLQIKAVTTRWPIYQEDITVLKLCVFSKVASKYLRQKLIELQGEMINPPSSIFIVLSMYLYWGLKKTVKM